MEWGWEGCKSEWKGLAWVIGVEWRWKGSKSGCKGRVFVTGVAYPIHNMLVNFFFAAL